MRHVIIGAGAAGISALQAIRSIDSNSEIKVINKEDVRPYSLSSLPFILSGELPEGEISRFSDDAFSALKADIITGRATSLKVDTKSIVLEDGNEISYDRLLIASGSSPIVPRIEGLDKLGVHFMGSLPDVWKLRDAATKSNKVVVIGAGFVGLEAAIALRKLGKEVTVVEMLDRVLPRMLDPDVATFVQQMLEEKGIKIILEDQVTDVLGEDCVEGVKTQKEEIECELVFVGIGVRPNIDFVKGTVIKTNFGVLVDDMMRTTAEDVYAAGDIVEAFDPLLGKPRMVAIWPNAIEQGRVAGRNMAGVETHYAGLDSVNIINIFDVPVVTLGLTSTDIEGTESFLVKRGGSVKKLITKDDKAVGIQSIGSVRNLGFILSLINNKQKLGSLKTKILDERFAYPVATR